jgi:hypothetical protein
MKTYLANELMKIARLPLNVLVEMDYIKKGIHGIYCDKKDGNSALLFLQQFVLSEEKFKIVTNTTNKLEVVSTEKPVTKFRINQYHADRDK